MYNQVNHGPHSGQGPRVPLQPAYLRAPPPPPHFQQGPPGPPAPNVYPHGPLATSSTVPRSLMQNTGQSYSVPSLLHGNSIVPQRFSSLGQNIQHSSHLGFQTHHIPPPVPPPLSSQSHQETSWAPGPLSRILPPPPPPPFHPCPPQPGDLQSLQHIQNPPPPPPPAGSGFVAPSSGGVYLHSTVGSCQMPSSVTPPPLPSSPPPVPPSPPPPPLAPNVTSQSSLAVHSDPNSNKVSGFELKTVDCDLNQDHESYTKVVNADRDELLSTKNEVLDLPPPPPGPLDEKTVQKIESLCHLISENGPAFVDKIRQNESQNLEYAFLFGGDPGTEAAISHTYFLWMKKKYNLEHRWNDKKSDSQLRPLTVESSGKLYDLHVATEGADSDMEIEDDITLSDKDPCLYSAIEPPTQQHDWLREEFSISKNMDQLQNTTKGDPAKDILSRSASYFGSLRGSGQHEGLGPQSDLEHMKSASSIHSPVNDSTEVDKVPLSTFLDKSAAPLADDFTQDGASDLKEAVNPDRDYGQLIISGSPIRLLQDYASDDTSDHEDATCAADSSVLAVSERATTGVSVSHEDSGNCLETDVGCKSPSGGPKRFSLLETSQNDSEMSPDPGQEFKGTSRRSVSRWTSDRCTEQNFDNQVSVNFSASMKALRGKDGLGSTGIDSGSKSSIAKQGDERKTSNFESNVLKVDEFGRHLREGPTDSDYSDDSCYRQTRRQNKRDRSWSRGRSPIDRRRRRRRSPRRRRDRRSRSRSRSPWNCRSRSRSPILRRSGDFSGEYVKKAKGQCFDFIRGKCYRGASCRYIHHESDMNASSRRYKNKHDLEVSSPKKCRINDGMKDNSSEVSGHEHDGLKKQDVDLCPNVIDQEVKLAIEDCVKPAVVSTTFCLNDQSVNNDPLKSESFRQVSNELQETFPVREETKTSVHVNESFQKAANSHQQNGSDVFKPSGGVYEDVIPSEDGSSVQKREYNVSVGVLDHSGYPSQIINLSFVSDSSADKRSVSTASKDTSIEPLPYMLPSTQLQPATNSVDQGPSSELHSLHSLASKELPLHCISSVELPLHTYQLPPPAIVSHSQVEKPLHLPPVTREYGMMQQNAFFPYQSTTREKFEPFPAPLHTQHSHLSVPPSSTLTSLPPPPPSRAVYTSSLNAGVARPFVSSEFNRSPLHSRTDFVTNPGLPSRSQSSDYPLMQQDHSQTLLLTEAFSPKPPLQGNPTSQLLAGPKLSREDHFKQLAMQDSRFSSSTSFRGMHPQHSLVNKLPPEEHFSTSGHVHPVSQKQQPVYNSQYNASEGNLGGETVTVSRYPPDVLDSNHSTSLAYRGSRISAHYNPYASTFEQPLSSKFSSGIFRRENDIIHGNTYGLSRLNHTPVNGGGIDVGLRQTTYSPKSSRAVGQILSRTGGDQYDPLFDSIEPLSSSLKKFDFDQKQEVTGESNVSLRPKSSYKSLDLEEKNKQEEVGAVASITSQNNDEYGETADAEVGAVENESLSNQVDVAIVNSGEVEINQVKSPRKRKTSKDSRSMKLFKVSIANFVKEVLKPSWRQGNMSKVAFKTIVKKTVDKVSGAMKGHRVPKSQAKINQYIDSSQRKLTKLVMGYVDKYVKV